MPVKPPAGPRQGWRYFQCPLCLCEWKETTRDSFSPSGESCPNCNDFCHPVKKELDTTVPVDSFGNLNKHQCVILKAGLPPLEYEE